MRLVAITESGAPAEALPEAPPVVGEVMTSTAALYGRHGHRPPWIGYLAIEDDRCVGTCAFKAPPAAGRVEIAYFTFPPHEGRGVATRMASALLDLARSADPGIEIVARTTPRSGASTRILERLGFEHLGSVEDPDDGTVWEWRAACDGVASP